MKVPASFVITLFLAAAPGAAFGGSLKVVPVRVYLDGPSSTAVLTLTNNGPDGITVQIGAKSWEQDEQGQDQYHETRDIVYFPRILELEPSSERIIRIGYQGPRVLESEGAYRLFLQELPLTGSGEQVLKLVLTLSIPVFVKPSVERTSFAIKPLEQAQGQLSVNVANEGNTHVLLDRITVRGLDSASRQAFSTEARGWYLLPDRSRTYELVVPQTGCSQAQKIQIELRAGSQTATTVVDSVASLCGTPDERQAGPAGEDVGRQAE